MNIPFLHTVVLTTVRHVQIIGTTLFVLLFVASPALAQDSLFSGLEETAGNAGLSAGQEGNVALLVGDIISAALGFVGVLFMVLIIYGGVRWMTAGGNEEAVSQAKRIIRNATVGLAIVVVSYTLSLFIFDVFLKATDPTYNTSCGG